jgi:cytochrome c-type biogenesis protein CcmH/NrfF
VSVLWILPLLFFTAGAVLVLLAAQQAAEAGIRLREESGRLAELRTVLVDLRADGEATRATLDRVRSRSVSGDPRG